MMLLHQFLVTRLFDWTNEPDKNLQEIQGSYSQMKYNSVFFIPHEETIVQNYL
jgi:hypothetical protein